MSRVWFQIFVMNIFFSYVWPMIQKSLTRDLPKPENKWGIGNYWGRKGHQRQNQNHTVGPTERRRLGGVLDIWFGGLSILEPPPLAAQVSLALHHLIFFLFFFKIYWILRLSRHHIIFYFLFSGKARIN